MKITNKINPNIFKEYDIRGIYETDLKKDTIYTIGKAFGSKLIEENKTETIIGYDNRKSSPIIFKYLTKGIIDAGINVKNIGLVTTPMYYYALTYFKQTSGIMITASHNPKKYNGLKITFNGHYNACGDDIRDFKNYIQSQKFKNGHGTINNISIEKEYINYLTSDIHIGSNKQKIVVDCGNGTPSIIIKKIFDKLDIDTTYLSCESDPDFPNHHPDPAVDENLEPVQKELLKNKATIGFSFDGDGDRIGTIDELGKIIKADELMIIIIRNIINKLDNKKFIYDVKCSKALEDEIIKLGGTPIINRTGNSYQRKKIYEENIPFGGELSGHIFFNDKFHGFDDAIYTALRIIEIVSNSTKTISEHLKGINKYYSTDEIKTKVDEDKKNEIIETFKKYTLSKGYNILDIDGCKVLFDDGFALVRASNTTPNITTRFEATSKERLKEIQNEFEKVLNNIEDTLT